MNADHARAKAATHDLAAWLEAELPGARAAFSTRVGGDSAPPFDTHNLGIPELRFFSRVNYGGGAACGTVMHAAMAVATGVADVVVCYRGFNERSVSRFGQVQGAAAAQMNTNGLDNAWTYPYGLSTPAATVFSRFLHHLFPFSSSLLSSINGQS